MNYFNNELFHSETYLGGDYTDELQHRAYKYIRRYKNVKGKWTYVYANRDTHRQIQSDLLTARVARNTQKRYQNVAKIYELDRVNSKDYTGELGKEFHKMSAKNALSANAAVNDDRRIAEKHEDAAYTAIRKNSVKSLAKDQVDKGVSAINKLFSKMKKKG